MDDHKEVYGYNSFAERVRNGYATKRWEQHWLLKFGFPMPWLGKQGWPRFSNKNRHYKVP